MRSRFIMYGVRIKIKNEHSYLLYTEEIEKLCHSLLEKSCYRTERIKQKRKKYVL